jgi:hypothetical protein
MPFLASFPPFTSYHTYFLQQQLKGMHRRPSTLPREIGDQSIANKNKNYVIIGICIFLKVLPLFHMPGELEGKFLIIVQ